MSEIGLISNSKYKRGLKQMFNPNDVSNLFLLSDSKIMSDLSLTPMTCLTTASCPTSSTCPT